MVPIGSLSFSAISFWVSPEKNASSRARFCSAGRASTAVRLSLIHICGFEADAMQAVVNDFNRSQDRIEVRFLSVSEVDTKLLLAASSGHPPDVAGLWSDNIPDFSEKGALTPLDGGLAAAGLGPDHYIPVFWELCRHRGFTWGLPTTPGCMALFYNCLLYTS